MSDSDNSLSKFENSYNCLESSEEFSRIAQLLSGAGRKIDEVGGFDVEIKEERTPQQKAENRPGDLLREKILNLPDLPGVYMYIDRFGKVIYVGKAKRLKRRVSSYFNRKHESVRTNLLVKNIRDLRFIVVPTEEDALHLEDAMIKEYQPRYNVLLKDDKSYPWIVVTDECYPRVFMTREKDVKGKYYGPYSNVATAKTMLQLIRDIFPLRSCRHKIDKESIKKGRYRLCLDYHLKKCQGACCGLVTDSEYAMIIQQIKQILNGETLLLTKYLKDRMEELSSQWKFEEAQDVKEKLELLEKYKAKSVISATIDGEIDAFAYVESGDSAYVTYIHLHKGAVIQSLNLEFRRRLAETPAEILSLSIVEIQRRFNRKFKEIIVPFEPDVDFEGVDIIVPKRGDRRKILDVAMKNATQYMADKEKMAEKLDPDRGVRKLMERMKSDFRMSKEPLHIECFDNSNIQGTNPVSSCVVFRNGKPAKRDYRHFIIKTVDGPDDFASMKEVLHRRYSRMISEGEALPDLVIVDGGKGQLSAAAEAFDELGIRGEVALIGIAKRLEEIYFPGDSYPLYIDKKSPSLRVVQALRDEAHRFGITHHRNRRSKSALTSIFDEIKGIGPTTAQQLMKKFKSIKRLKEATQEEIEEVIGRAKAKIIVDFFHDNDNK